MTQKDREHRRFVYQFARAALMRKATQAEVEYAVELLTPLSGHKALGFRVRLQRKLSGEPWSWGEM